MVVELDNSAYTNGHTNGKTSLKKIHQKDVDGFGTRAIHVGSEPDPSTGAVIPALSLSTTYAQDGVGNHKGFEYSRSGNPNRNALEKTLASLESGGAHALAFASGSATTATMISALGPNSHVVSVNDVYGGTYRYLSKVAQANQGVQTTFVDLETASEEAIRDAIQENTKLIWIESPTNPTLRLIDIPRITSIARSHPSNPLVLVDNTFLSPFYSSPLLLGADIVLHSLTKYVNGHSDVVMGALILPAHHTELHSRLAFLQNAIGAIPSPHDCWLAQRGAKTLHVRMKEHGRNALMVARALEKSPLVKEVIYPGLVSHPRNALARSSLSPHASRFVESYLSSEKASLDLDGESAYDGSFPYGGMISFRILGGLRESQRFLKATRLFTLAESLGGVESLAELPAQMTHGSIPEADRTRLGIGEDLIRLSVGIEEGEDLVRDVLTALEIALTDEEI